MFSLPLLKSLLLAIGSFGKGLVPFPVTFGDTAGGCRGDLGAKISHVEA